MTTRITPRSGVTFRDRSEDLKPRYGSDRDRGRQSTQESEVEDTPRASRYSQRNKGEFSGNFDKSGHHLKSDGTLDLRFRENRDRTSGETSPRTNMPLSNKNQVQFSGDLDLSGHHLKADGTPDMRFIENRTPSQQDTEGASRISPRSFSKSQYKSTGRGKSSTQRQTKRSKSGMRSKSRLRPSAKEERTKSDGTPDMRYKENRINHQGEGFENTTSSSSRYLMTKANAGIVEGNTPGEHSGKFDGEGRHLKDDGTPDMRFRENRAEFEGQGFEQQRDENGNKIKTPRYLQDEDSAFTDKIYYKRKRPPTPYALYVKENASNMKRENPEMDMNEVFRELGEQWRNSTDKYKQSFYDMYNEEVKRFEDTNHLPHRGNLSFRKAAQNRGLKIDTNIKYEKRGKNSGRNRMRNVRDHDDDNEEEDDEEDYTPNRNEEEITA